MADGTTEYTAKTNTPPEYTAKTGTSELGTIPTEYTAKTSGNELSLEGEIYQRAEKMAEQILAQRATRASVEGSGRIFTYFKPEEDIIRDQKQIVTTGLWSNNTGSLLTFYSSSAETATQKTYYLDTYNLDPVTDDDAEVQFSLAFGHKYGSGSESNNYRYSSKAIYAQYKSLLLDSSAELFTFGDSTTSDKIYTIAMQRERMKDKINAGNWELNLAKLTGDTYANTDYTGSNIAVSASNEIITLVDYSLASSSSIASTENEYYYIVSGSITNGVYTGVTDPATPTHYGIFYPKKGVMVLNGDKLNTNLGFNSVTSSNVDGENIFKLFTSISGSAIIDTTKAFIARSEEEIASTYYFVRAKNAEYNYSNNTSFTTGSLGELKHKTFINDPKTYVTEIGLYNEDNELLAITKVSQPIQKAFNKEVSFAVKLDF